MNHRVNSDLNLELNGLHWKMQKIRPGAGVKEGFHQLPAEFQGTYFNWNQAQVPGDVYTDLRRAGEIDDPYFGRNFGRAKWVQEYEIGIYVNLMLHQQCREKE